MGDKKFTTEANTYLLYKGADDLRGSVYKNVKKGRLVTAFNIAKDKEIMRQDFEIGRIIFEDYAVGSYEPQNTQSIWFGKEIFADEVTSKTDPKIADAVRAGARVVVAKTMKKHYVIGDDDVVISV